MVRIMSMVTRVRASFGYRLDVIRHSKSIAGECDKIFFSFLVIGDSLRYFMILALRSFFSFFIPPSTSRAVGSLSLQWVSGCFSRLLAISWSSILKDVWYSLGVQYSAREFILSSKTTVLRSVPFFHSSVPFLCSVIVARSLLCLYLLK